MQGLDASPLLVGPQARHSRLSHCRWGGRLAGTFCFIKRTGNWDPWPVATIFLLSVHDESARLAARPVIAGRAGLARRARLAGPQARRSSQHRRKTCEVCSLPSVLSARRDWLGFAAVGRPRRPVGPPGRCRESTTLRSHVGWQGFWLAARRSPPLPAGPRARRCNDPCKSVGWQGRLAVSVAVGRAAGSPQQSVSVKAGQFTAPQRAARGPARHRAPLAVAAGQGTLAADVVAAGLHCKSLVPRMGWRGLGLATQRRCRSGRGLAATIIV